jgi:hypothetical protein
MDEGSGDSTNYETDQLLRFGIELDRFGTRMRLLEPYGTEGLLILCSLWAGWTLTANPLNFPIRPEIFHVASLIQPNERVWGIFALISALTKIVGLLLTFIRRLFVFAVLLRCLGLSLSTLFWLIMGSSLLVGNPDSVFALPIITQGLSALWVLIRFPVFPVAPPGFMRK